MYNVGFVDNTFDLHPDYQTRLRRHDIKLLFPEAGKRKEEIVQWVLDNDIRCLLIDHRLIPDFDFVGADLLAYMNSALPDLPCMILTAYGEESLQDHLVTHNMVESRDLMEGNPVVFSEKLKQAVAVFGKRLELHENEYRVLLDIKHKGAIVAQQEERLAYLYRLLRSYGEIDDLPTELLKSEMEEKINSLINKLSTFLDRVSSVSEKEDV